MGDKFMNGGTEKLGDVNDTKFADPTGKFQGAMDQFSKSFTDQAGNFDPNAAYNAFMGQTPGMINMVAGATGPLSQMLDAQAQRDARLGGEAALASMPGAQNSGAGMAAFGTAYADPFARAAIQTQQAQLGLLSPLMQGAQQGQYGLMSQGMSQYGDMASKMGDIWSPTYQKKKSGWSTLMDVAGLGVNALDAFIPG